MERLTMERFMGLQILKRLKRNRKYKEAMQYLEDHFRLSYREVDEANAESYFFLSIRFFHFCFRLLNAVWGRFISYFFSG